EEREEMVLPLLQELPKRTQDDILWLRTLAPSELQGMHRHLLVNLEFEQPIPSRLGKAKTTGGRDHVRSGIAVEPRGIESSEALQFADDFERDRAVRCPAAAHRLLAPYDPMPAAGPRSHNRLRRDLQDAGGPAPAGRALGRPLGGLLPLCRQPT